MIAGGGGDEQARMRYGLRVLEEEWSAQVIDINNNFCLIRLYTVCLAVYTRWMCSPW